MAQATQLGGVRFFTKPGTKAYDSLKWIKRDAAITNPATGKTFFEQKVTAIDSASFIGFPGTRESKWWDTEWELPVARTVNIASQPSTPFSNPRCIGTSRAGGWQFAARTNR